MLHRCCVFTGTAAVSLALGGCDASCGAGNRDSATPHGLHGCLSNGLACREGKS